MPDSIAQQPICKNWQPDEPVQPNRARQAQCGQIYRNWQPDELVRPNLAAQAQCSQIGPASRANSFETGNLLADYMQMAQCQTATHSCYVPMGHGRESIDVSRLPGNWQENLSNFDTWQTSVPADSHVYGDYSQKPERMTDKLASMSFQKLLGLADADESEAALQNALSEKDFIPRGRQLEFGGPHFRPPIKRGVGAIPSMLSFDLNATPKMTTDSVYSRSISFQYEPITPQKVNKPEHYQQKKMPINKPPVTVIDLTIDEEPTGKDAQIQVEKSSATSNHQLRENHKPDKGGKDEADLTKTPQQKVRRRKHRPKVIIEGQKKSTPKSLKKPAGSQESTSVRRKYVQKKGVANPLGNETDVADPKKKEPTSLDTLTRKRKYTRRKGVAKPEGEVDKETTKTPNSKASRISQSSCRRTLNFSSNSQARGEISFQYPSSNCDGNLYAQGHSTAQTARPYGQGTTKKDDVTSPPERTQSMDQVQEDNMAGHHTGPTRGKCQIVFLDVTHDKETNSIQERMTPNSSMCSSIFWVPERQLRGLKRQNVSTSEVSEISNRNETEAYNFMQAYIPLFSQNVDKSNALPGLHFPIIHKKKKFEKVYNMGTSSSQLKVHTLRDSCTNQITSEGNQGFSGGPYDIANLQRTSPANDALQTGREVYEDLLALGPKEIIRKKRSKSSTRMRNLASLLEIRRQKPASTSKVVTPPSATKQKITIPHEPPTCMEALVADTRTVLKTKKHTNRSVLANSIGPPLALTWRTISPVDSITEQLNKLDLNATNETSKEKWNAFKAYHSQYLEKRALVPFQRSGALIPFDGSFDNARRRRPRPKVILDDETTRVWELLLENINNEGIDGTDEEKTKWWEEERRIFNGRANSFIARMRLVQGDRQFSPWKGSVVDSVVGVFLTQNVSDHLSSSAFMSVAARFPLKQKTQPAELREEKRCTEEICELYREGNFGLNESIYGDRHEVIECDSIREANSVNTSKNSSDGFFLKDKSKHDLVTSIETAANKPKSLIKDGRDAEDTISFQTPDISSQNSSNSQIAQTIGRTDSLSTSEELKGCVESIGFDSSTSFIKLLQMAGTVLHGNFNEGGEKINSDVNNRQCQSGSLVLDLQNKVHLDSPMYPVETTSPSNSTLCDVPNAGSQAILLDLCKKNSRFFNSSTNRDPCLGEISEPSSESVYGTAFQKIRDVCFKEEPKLSSMNATSDNNDQGSMNATSGNNDQVSAQSSYQEIYNMQKVSKGLIYPQNLADITGSSSNIDNLKNPEHIEVNSNKSDAEKHRGKVGGPKGKGGRPRKDKENWDHLRKQANAGGKERERTVNTMDSVDWDAVRCADVNDIAQSIKERGMNNILAERIKDFLNRIVRDHGSIDLEWLRDVPPDKAKEYLLSMRGLGLKSVECVRLLTLHHLAFPVDTNVGRIAVRLGWVPLQPLPESLQLHLLELYPILESIQKYLWPRLCKLDQRTLYELHYQMITFGKVFCTKSKPNCNACPMRGECRHFTSAFASARLSLPAPEDKSIISATENRTADQNSMRSMNTFHTLQLPSPEANPMNARSGASYSQPIIEEPSSPEPIIEVPATPERDHTQVPQCDIENAFNEDPDEIPTIQLNMEEFTHNLQKIMKNTELQEGNMSKALVALTSAAASIPVPKLKNVRRLRTEHQVYELPDSHPLLEGMDKREPDDPSPYLLAIWTPGETTNSIEPPERRCSSKEYDKLCTDEACSSCNSIREAETQTVRGTLLIPCRTAMRGSFPLNGTYFQVNEVFSDHESSLFPIAVPREWLWNLPRRTVYFGTSIPSIFKGLTTEEIQYCFWRGFVCVRGFDKRTRAPRPLIARLHFPASRLGKGKGKTDGN
ncbi:Transcriptional activator DEMETER [Striga hermonthica]|uniref:Transcriptional activator DEMETER n=1 Tax=Striga hermonthica TaxID=68872 RepID=A0A9N7N2Q1_STRHE|nr:Transcriptional activator DEMETER [Striga hermonthica]